MKPDANVYTRLFVSPIHGVGVQAICDIPKGTDIFNEAGSADDDFFEIPECEVAGMPPSPIKQLYLDFAVLDSGTWYCPHSFNEMTVSYYLNHSKTPNCEAVKGGIYFVAARDILAGEELTVDYEDYCDFALGEQ
jgi:hypothetical protein